MTSTSDRIKKEQLQKRIAEIDALFTTQTEHLLYLYGFVPGGLQCRSCSSVHLDFLEGHRKAVCLVCNKVTYLTARTFFHGVRRPVDWVRAIFLIEEGYSFSGNMFAEVTGMAQASAHALLAKLRIVINNTMLETETESSSKFLPVMLRRSRFTPAMGHPVSEQDLFDEIEEENIATSVDDCVDQAMKTFYGDTAKPMVESTQQAESANELSGGGGTSVIAINDPEASKEPPWATAKNIFRLLSREPSSIDSLIAQLQLPTGEVIGSLMEMQMAGLIEPGPSNSYVRKRLITILSTEPKSIFYFQPFFKWVRDVYRGISRKYLQLYLAKFWAELKRLRWGVGALFTACFKSRRLTRRDVNHYFSPPVVSYSLAPKQQS